MKKIIHVCLTLLSLAFFLTACGPSRKAAVDETQLCIPQGLTVDSTGNAYLRIQWNMACPGSRVMRGFNIYLSDSPVTDEFPGRQRPDIKPYNNDLYPGDTLGRPTIESFVFENIPTAQVHYIHVRTVYNDGSVSIPTNELEVIVYPQGTLELGVSYSGDHDGYSFAENSYVNTDALSNDIYYYNRDGADYLCSASRISAINRNTKLYSAGNGTDIGSVENIVPVGNPDERLDIHTGDIIVAITEEGYPAKLRVAGFDGSGEDRIVKLEFFYKPPVRQPGQGS